MAILTLILSLFVLLAMTSAEPEDPISKLVGRVYIKNVKQQKYLIFDALSTDIEPKVLLWNVANTIPPKGGAWFRLSQSPTKKPTKNVDYNLVGAKGIFNQTLCASMKKPKGVSFYRQVHGTVDHDYLGAPECRWKIKRTPDKKYWLINTLYKGHLRAVNSKYNVDPLRRLVFLNLKENNRDKSEKWEIGTVVEPNDKPSYEYSYDYSYDYSYNESYYDYWNKP